MLNTIYGKALAAIVAEHCRGMTPRDVLADLCEKQLLDPTRCKAFLAREMVAGLVAGGKSKIEAMYTAAEHLCCSYECIRKYIYNNYK